MGWWLITQHVKLRYALLTNYHQMKRRNELEGSGLC